jgi:hypothetical protein
LEVGPGFDAVAWPCVDRLPPPPASALPAVTKTSVAAASQALARKKLLQIELFVMTTSAHRCLPLPPEWLSAGCINSLDVVTLDVVTVEIPPFGRDFLGVAVIARSSDPAVPAIGVRPPLRACVHVPWLQTKQTFEVAEHPLPVPVLWLKSPEQPFVLLQAASTAPMEAPLARADVPGANVKSVKTNGARARSVTRLQDIVRGKVIIILSCGVPELRRVAPNLAQP